MALCDTHEMISGMFTVYLHCVLLGICRMFLHLWIQSCHHEELWCIGDQVAIIDDRLPSIKPSMRFSVTQEVFPDV